MTFNSWQEADNRLRTNSAKLTPEEVRDLMPHMNQISETGMRRPAMGGKTSPRKSPLNGIQFNDAKGDEFGGLGMMDDGSMILCFDSKTSEATCIYSLANSERGFSVTDDQGKDRAVMEIGQDTSVSVSINDENAKPRATIRIGSGAAPELRLTGPDGKLIWAAPKSK